MNSDVREFMKVVENFKSGFVFITTDDEGQIYCSIAHFIISHGKYQLMVNCYFVRPDSGFSSHQMHYTDLQMSFRGTSCD